MENYSFSKFNSTIVKSYESECLLYEKLWRIQLAFRFDLYENTKNLDSRYKLYKSRKSQLLKDGHSEMDSSYLSCQLLSNYNYLVYDNQIIQNDLNFLSNVLYKHYERVVLFLVLAAIASPTISLIFNTFESRIYLMFMHFSIILQFFNNKNIKFPQYIYD